jgi:hypothetical protein
LPTYPVDIAAEQVVRWLLDEQRSGYLPVEVRATRQYVIEPLDRPEDVEVDREDEASYVRPNTRPAPKLARSSATGFPSDYRCRI